MKLIQMMVGGVVLSMTITLQGVSENATADAKSILSRIQNRLQSAKSVKVIVRENLKGVNVETKFMGKQIEKDIISFRQESVALVAGEKQQPFIQLMDRNKLYFFPTGCGNVVVRMKFMEDKKQNFLAQLFRSDGKVEMLKGNDTLYSIRYICAQEEIDEMEKDLKKKFGKAFNKELIPSILEYKITKKDLTLTEIIGYSEKGRLIKRQMISDWAFDLAIPDSTFQVPSKYKLYTANSEKEAERIQAELVKKALARQHGK